MKISIVGEKERAAAWEKHVRKLTAVKEVVITSDLQVADNPNAVLLIDDSNENLQRLLNSIKAGHHTFLISKLPTDPIMIEKVYHASAEANVNVQFSHWPSISESMNWIHQQVKKPNLLQIKKETVPRNYRVIDSEDFEYDWIDELALVIKWMGGNIHRYEVKPIKLGTIPLGLSLTLRYENSAVVSMQYLASSVKERHQRIFSNQHIMADFNVIKQNIRLHKLNDLNRITILEKVFDPTDTAEWSVVQFIKSIQLGQPTLFSPYDALLTARAADKIKSLILNN
ncbi:MAG: hypothetical protein EA359_04960 [Balneolaceae bacterium]|nr:MAG: hypothetical protein EA359_04960 [Balneolaceae bacterium]